MGAFTKEELKYKTEKNLKKLKERGMIINKDKYKLNCDNESYLGCQKMEYHPIKN